MGTPGPLDDPALSSIADALREGDIRSAQHQLAALDQEQALQPGAVFLTIWLLYMRGKLDPSGVIERLGDLLGSYPDFPEAKIMLDLAKSNQLPEPSPISSQSLAPVRPSAAARRPSNAEVMATPTQPPSVRQFGSQRVQRKATTPGMASGNPPRVSSGRWTAANERASRRGTEREEPRPASAAPDSPSIRSGPNVDAPPPSFQPPTPRPYDKRLSERAPPEVPRSARDSAPRLAVRGSGPPLKPSDDVVERETRDSDVLRARFERALEDPGAEPDTVPPSDRSTMTDRAPLSPVSSLDLGDERPSNPFDLNIPRAPAVPEFPGRMPAQFSGKGKLRADAGRYSGAPSEPESIRPQKGRRRDPPSLEHVSAPATRSTQSAKASVPPRLSGPPTFVDARVSLHPIIHLIEERRFEEALRELQQRKGGEDPQALLLRARCHAGLGQRQAALAALHQMEQAPTGDTQLEAECAQLLVQLGAVERAIAQAVRTLDVAPDDPRVRYSFAWVIVRAARRRNDEFLLEQAERALVGLSQQPDIDRMGVAALEAAIWARIGVAETASAQAREVLSNSPNRIDALAALAESAARQNRIGETNESYIRLRRLAPEEASAVKRRLEELDASFAAPDSERDPSYWHPIEVALSNNETNAAVRQMVDLSERYLSELGWPPGEQGLVIVGGAAGPWLSTTPVFQHFCAFDYSLASLLRIEAAIETLLGPGAYAETVPEDSPFALLTGCYVGETLRRCFGSNWEGTLDDPTHARIIAGHRSWTPIGIIGSRIRLGATAEIRAGLRSVLSNTDAPQWEYAQPVADMGIYPWGDQRWPDVTTLAGAGRQLSRSALHGFAHRFGYPRLNFSTISLTTMDEYLSVLTPRTPPTRPQRDADWAHRAALLVGGYFGETLCRSLDGRWLEARAPMGVQDYKVLVAGQVEFKPVWEVFRRLQGEAVSLSETAQRLMERTQRV